MLKHIERIIEINTRISRGVTAAVGSVLKRVTESGKTRMTESGEYRILESETK